MFPAPCFGYGGYWKKYMSKIELLDTGLVYRNPRPHVESRHAYFPSVVQLANGDIVVTMSIGQAFESRDQHVYAARSGDNGKTWDIAGPVYKPTGSGVLTSEYCRITAAPQDEIIGFLIKYNRSRDCGLTNEENMGFVETELTITRSLDKGRTWSAPAAFTPPLIGPSFEMCCPIRILSDGRWIIPTSTWRGFDGYCPNGMKAIALVSHDQGNTWPDYLDVMDGSKQGIIFWESRVLQLSDKRLLGVAWTYDERNKKDLSNHYSVSDPEGKVFCAARPTGLAGQTLEPILLEDGRILSLYRRVDSPGLWANISRIEEDRWVNECESPIWGCSGGQRVSSDKNMVSNFHALRFGAPSAVFLLDGCIFAAIWAVEDCVGNIRWFKIKIS